MRINVLGLGESLSFYTKSNDITIGVNDICKYITTDHVVCVDPPNRFTEDRIKTIINGKQKKFLTHYNQWEKLVENYTPITLQNPRGVVNLDTESYCYSISSVYVAVVHAYKLGAKEIIIYGADFKTHPTLSSKTDRILKDFKALHDELQRRNVDLFVCSNNSVLSNIIKIW